MLWFVVNHFEIIGPKAAEFGGITQNNSHCTIQGHSTWFKVTNFGTNRKPICDFLSLINTNLHPISHRFHIIADYWSNVRFRQGVPLSYELVQGEPINSELQNLA